MRQVLIRNETTDDSIRQKNRCSRTADQVRYAIHKCIIERKSKIQSAPDNDFIIARKQMKTITNEQIGEELTSVYSKSSIENTKAVLFISEFDDQVEERINSWASAYDFFIADELYPNISDISENKIVHIHYDCGFDTDEECEWRDNERRAVHKLIKKDNQLKLIIVSMFSPLWTNGTSIFSKDDTFFDEIISVKLT